MSQKLKIIPYISIITILKIKEELDLGIGGPFFRQKFVRILIEKKMSKVQIVEVNLPFGMTETGLNFWFAVCTTV